MKSNDLRKKFLEFFKNKNHRIIKSDSLVPSNDPTLLFTSAGMVQFKPYYMSKGKLEFTRAVSCQKCFRTPDLERVGHTPRHHTFFEMLGNFSFGDYFKKEGIEWAWEFIVDVLKLSKNDLWISIYLDDEEAFEIWNKSVGISNDRIVRLGKDENFWGPVNPEGGVCGPCSEIYVDWGIKKGCGKPDCGPGCDCDRFEEFWNLVFPSFNMDLNGKLNPLEKKGIDTGMGLERLTSILQGKDNNFEIDIIRPIMDKISEEAELKYDTAKDKQTQIKIITDHIRAITFLISDGVLPSNESRGYVLRRILRRAVRQGKLINIENPFLYKLVRVVGDMMFEQYPEITERREYISQVVFNEEERFNETLGKGMDVLNELCDKYKKQGVVSGSDTFKLYDTYGFPYELTVEILQEKGLKANENDFLMELEKQKERGRKAWKGVDASEISQVYHSFVNEFGNTVFLGYDSLNTDSKVLAIIKDDVKLDNAKSEEIVDVLFDKTPFYGESGGQVGDTGTLFSDTGLEAVVLDTKKILNNLIVHKIEIKTGEIKVGYIVEAKVDLERRLAIARHHTATHLLQAGLREVLGKHINQSGSVVDEQRLRFDFTHFSSISKQELDRVEEIINKKVMENLQVNIEEMGLKEARKNGATALFSEKYQDIVRVVSIGGFSKELCGGTHLKATGQIGLVRIIGESSISSGVRRIEAVAGLNAYKYIKDNEEIIYDISDRLKSDPKGLLQKLDKLFARIKELEKEIDSIKSSIASASSGKNLMDNVKEINGLEVLIARMDDFDIDSLRKTSDNLKDKIKSGIIVLGGVRDGKVNLVLSVTSNLTGRINAGKLIKEIAKKVNGSGGGRHDFAQAGGKNPSMLDDALNIDFIETLLK